MAKNLKPSDLGGLPEDAISAKTLQRLRKLREQGRAVYRSGLDPTAVAEQIIDEMARRQGQKLGPYFEWSLATADFTIRFNEAFSRRPPKQSIKKFASAFVDAWPPGMAALRLASHDDDIFPGSPYAKEGLWPAYLSKGQTRTGKTRGSK